MAQPNSAWASASAPRKTSSESCSVGGSRAGSASSEARPPPPPKLRHRNGVARWPGGPRNPAHPWLKWRALQLRIKPHGNQRRGRRLRLAEPCNLPLQRKDLLCQPVRRQRRRRSVAKRAATAPHRRHYPHGGPNGVVLGLRRSCCLQRRRVLRGKSTRLCPEQRAVARCALSPMPQRTSEWRGAAGRRPRLGALGSSMTPGPNASPQGQAHNTHFIRGSHVAFSDMRG